MRAQVCTNTGMKITIASTACLFWLACFAATPTVSQDYSAVDAIFSRHCLDCHASQDPEHGLVLENYEALMKGGETGPAIVAEKSDESLLIQMVEGRFEKEGKIKVMPPGKRKKLAPEEIAALRAWIDAGAKEPITPPIARELSVPRIVPKATPRNPVNALACSANARLVAAGRYGQVQLQDAKDFRLIRTLSGPKGNVNTVLFSPNDSEVFAAGGEPAIGGEVRQWRVADGELLHTFPVTKTPFMPWLFLRMPQSWLLAAMIRK